MNEAARRVLSLQPHALERGLIASIERSPLRKEPFDHIYMEDVIQHADYKALLAAMPDRRFYHELSHLDAMRADGTSTRLRMYLYPELLRKLPTDQKRVWLPVARALCSSRL